MTPPVSIAVIGKGRLGRSLAAAIGERMEYFTLHSHLSARAKSFASLKRIGGPDVVFIVCSDRYVAAVSKRVLAACGLNTYLLVHCAGSLPSSILPVREDTYRLMLHPIQTFPNDSSASFEGLTFGYETEDREAARFALSFVKNIGGARAIPLTAEQLPIYHAANVIAANFITLLGAGVESLAPGLDMTTADLKHALAPLMRTALESVLSAPASQVLTGPIARNDAETIKRHRDGLRKAGHKELLKLYDTFLALARELT